MKKAIHTISINLFLAATAITGCYGSRPGVPGQDGRIERFADAGGIGIEEDTTKHHYIGLDARVEDTKIDAGYPACSTIIEFEDLKGYACGGIELQRDTNGETTWIRNGKEIPIHYREPSSPLEFPIAPYEAILLSHSDERAVGSVSAYIGVERGNARFIEDCVESEYVVELDDNYRGYLSIGGYNHRVNVDPLTGNINIDFNRDGLINGGVVSFPTPDGEKSVDDLFECS